MKTRLLLSSLVLCSLLLATGCPKEVETVWAKTGTPARVIDKKEVKVTDKDKNPKTVTGEQIVDDSPVEHLITKDNGEIETSKSSLKGLMVIDESTLEYYKTLDKLYGADYRRRMAAGEFDKK